MRHKRRRGKISGVYKVISFLLTTAIQKTTKSAYSTEQMGARRSKQNMFGVKMVLRIVRYLVQQGYGTDNIVVLTPYLGQLSLLRDAFKSETGTSLSVLDSNHLSSAGLLGHSGSHKKTDIRPATIGTRHSTRRIVR